MNVWVILKYLWRSSFWDGKIRSNPVPVRLRPEFFIISGRTLFFRLRLVCIFPVLPSGLRSAVLLIILLSVWWYNSFSSFFISNPSPSIIFSLHLLKGWCAYLTGGWFWYKTKYHYFLVVSGKCYLNPISNNDIYNRYSMARWNSSLKPV